MKSFNLFFIRHNRSVPAKQLVRSKIPFFDLTVLLKGSLAYTIDGQTVPLSAGDCILIRKNSVGKYELINFDENKIENKEMSKKMAIAFNQQLTSFKSNHRFMRNFKYDPSNESSL